MNPAASSGPDGDEQVTAATYRGGRWHGLVAPGALALLHPDVPADVAGELWQLATEGKRLGAWVEYLAAAGIRALPSFAMVEHHDRGLRVLVRGGVEVVVGEHRIDGRGYATWREEVLDEVGEVLLRAEGGDGPWWPIVAGLVPAAELRASLAAAQSRNEEDVELTVARMPALAAALRPTAAPAAAPQAAEPAVAHTDERRAPQPAREAATPPEGARAAEGPATEEDGDDYDHLLWSTEQQTTRGAALAADEGAHGATDGEAAAIGGSAAPDLEQADSPWQPPAQPARPAATALAAAHAEQERAIIDSVAAPVACATRPRSHLAPRAERCAARPATTRTVAPRAARGTCRRSTVGR